MTLSYAPFALLIGALLSCLAFNLSFALATPLLPLPEEFSYLARLDGSSVSEIAPRQDGQPVFPDQPPSCPICEQNFGSIDSCAQAAPVLANFSMIIFNPGAFIDVIKCACADTFQSAYPQCVDCFTQTNQTQFLNSSDLPSVLTGIRNICAIESTLLGGVATADGEVTPTTSLNVPQATAPTSGATSSSPSVGGAVILAMAYGLLAALL